MEPTIELRVVSHSGETLRAVVSHVRMTSPNGSFGVLPGHAPMLAAILPGEIIYDDDKGRHTYVTQGGVAQVTSDSVTVME